MSLELISLDLSNYCSKECNFCYNHSNTLGQVHWLTDEVIRFALDCSANGVKAISFGGGEPFEYNGIFDIITTLTPHLFVSITSNGIPLIKNDVFEKLISSKPNKIHISVHHPNDYEEVKRAIYLVRKICKHNIKAGINMLVSANNIESANKAVYWLYRNGIAKNQIIFIPMKGVNTPSIKQMTEVVSSPQFQSTFCLIECKTSERFCSISYDKKVGFCSYTTSKQQLDELTYQGLINSLRKIKHINTCQIIKT